MSDSSKSIRFVGCVGAALALAVVLLLPSHRIRADGIMLPSGDAWRRERERALITEVEQKAFVLYQRGMENLFISPSYRGRARDFAWVVPVPSRPQVSILQGAVFHELARITYPRGLTAEAKPRRATDAVAAAPSGVQLLERKTVGAYDVSVLAATDSRALVRWLDRNDYYLPPAALRPVEQYVREHWTFVACRIKTPDSAQGLATGTLAPLHLRFTSPYPIYPMRLSSANPEPFSVLVYVALPSLYGIDRSPDPRLPLTVRRGPSGTVGSVTPRRARLRPDVYSAPTLARLTQSGIDIHVERRTLTPEACTADYIWERGRDVEDYRPVR